MKFLELKSLLEQGKLNEFDQQLEKQKLVAADYSLLLRQIIKNKVKNIKKNFQELIKLGADVNFKHVLDKKSNLMVACEQGTLQSVELLCSHPQIDFGLQDSMKKTAAFYAIQNKNKNDGEVFLDKVLKKAPHLINRPANNQTILISAIKKKKPELVRILLNNGAQPNYIIPDSGNTPLHEALKICKSQQTKANKQIIKLLIQYGANPLIKNKKDKDAYEFAEKFPLKILIQQCQSKPELVEQQSIANKKQQQNKENKAFKATTNKRTVLISNSQHQNSDSHKKSDRFNEKQSKIVSPRHVSSNRKEDSYQKKEELKSQLNQKHFVINQFQLDLDETSSDESDQQLTAYQNEKSNSLTAYSRQQEVIQDLTKQIQEYAKTCEKQHKAVTEDVQQFLQILRTIANKQGFDVKLYGSFSTSLWLKHCDIDFLLIPNDQFISERYQNGSQNILENLELLLKKHPNLTIKNFAKNKKIKTQMLKFDVQFLNKKDAVCKLRKIDIAIIDRNHNGLAIVNYITQSLKMFPFLKPLFYVIKSLTSQSQAYNTKIGGIRTYAIIIMILSFLQGLGISHEQYSVGQLLRRFLFFFGFQYQYGYAYAIENPQDQPMENIAPTMVLNVYDPLNHSNNVGKNTKAYQLQAVFKAAYIGMHSNIKGKKLQFMFDLRKIILPF